MTESRQEGVGPKSAPRAVLGAPSWIVLFLLAVTPPAFATGLSNFEMLKELLLVGGMGLAGVIWGLGLLRRGRVTMAPGRVTLLMLLFAGYALAATLWADNQLWGLWESLHFVALAAAVLIVSAPIGRPLRFFDFALASGVGALVAGIFGVLDLAGVGLFSVVWDAPGPAGAFDAMEFGVAYYVVVLPILLTAAIRYAGKSRVFFGLAFAFSAIHFALLSTWTWLGIFAAICVIAAFLVGALRRSQSLKVIASSVVLVGVVGVLVAIAHLGLELDKKPTNATNLPRLMNPEYFDEDAAARAEGRAQDMLFSPDRTESVQDWEAHGYLISVASDLFGDKPILGRGAGGWWPAQTVYPHAEHPFVVNMFEFYPAFRSPHNAVIKLLVEYGLVGIVLFGLWLVSVLWVALAAVFAREEGAGDDAGGGQKWVLEHWAMLCAALAGLVFMLFTPLLSLAPAALAWVIALAVLARVSAGLNEFRGWSTVWQASTAPDGRVAHGGVLRAGAILAVLVGLGVLVPTVLQAGSAVYRGKADQLMRATAYGPAIDAYKTAFEWYPAAGDVPLNIGLASVKTGRLGEAESWVNRAAKLRPYDVRAISLQGRLLLRHPDTSMVVGLGNKAVAAFPNSIEARNLLISALDLQARYEEAAVQAIEIIERKPPRAQLGKLHKLAADLYADFLNKPTKARAHYEAAIKNIDSPNMRTKLQQKVDKINELVDQKRRMREGKSVRPTPADARGHDHAH